MRGRPVALGACAVALLLGAAPPAVGQDPPMPPAAEAPAPGTAPPRPAPEPAPGPAEAAPSTAAPADAAPEPAASPASAELVAAEPAAPVAGPKPSTGPVVEETAATPPRAEPAATPPRRAGRAARATTGARPRKGVLRTRPRRAANMSQADVQVSEFGGRVTLADVQVLGCSESSCDSGLADYEVQDLQVRGEPGGDVLIAVRRAQVTGIDGDRGANRRVTAQVLLRPPGEGGQAGEVTLVPGRDLLTQDVFAGTPLEDAYARLFASSGALFGPGGALERLTIVFGEGTVVEGAFGAVSVSAADRRITVGVPVRPAGGTLVRAGPLRVEAGETDSAAPSPKRAADLRQANGDAPRPPDTGGDSGGGFAKPGAIEQEDDEPEDEGGGGLFGTIISTCVLGVGACGGDDDEDERVVRFVVDSRSTTITIDDEGRGTIEIGCPSGVDDVSGTALIESEIRIGVPQRALSRAAEFSCDGEIVRIDIQVLDAELDRLRDEQGPVAARITVRVTADDGLRAVDFDVVTLELAAG